MFDHSDHAHVAWDVETTGFGWTDGITVSGLWFPGGHAALVLNPGPHHADGEQLAESLTDTSEAAVRVRVAEDENELLTPMGRVLFERFDREYNRLGAYNADSWQGGSGLPLSARGASSRASTGRSTVSRPPTCGSRSGNDSARPRRRTDRRRGRNSPTGAHTILFDSTRRESVLDGSDGHVWYAEYDYDPFADSGSAAARYREGNLRRVLEHNLADVHRTRELGELVRRSRPREGPHRQEALMSPVVSRGVSRQLCATLAGEAATRPAVAQAATGRSRPLVPCGRRTVRDRTAQVVPL